MTRRHYSSSAADTTLSGSISAGATSISVGSITGHPVQFPYTLILDPETASEEVVTVTAGTGTSLTVTRGEDGTTALSHTAGAVVRHGVSARDYDEPNAHIDAETNVHGVTGSVVGTSDTQTLTGKTLSVDDNDISGLAASSFVISDAAGVIEGSAAAKSVPTGTVVGTTDTQTLTGKTLTSPVINTGDINNPDIDGGTIDGATIGSNTLSGTLSGAGSVDITGSVAADGGVSSTGGMFAGGGITAEGHVALIDGSREIILGYNGSGGLSIGNSTPATHPNAAVLWFNGTHLYSRMPGGNDVQLT